MHNVFGHRFEGNSRHGVLWLLDPRKMIDIPLFGLGPNGFQLFLVRSLEVREGTTKTPPGSSSHLQNDFVHGLPITKIFLNMHIIAIQIQTSCRCMASLCNYGTPRPRTIALGRLGRKQVFPQDDVLHQSGHSQKKAGRPDRRSHIGDPVPGIWSRPREHLRMRVTVE